MVGVARSVVLKMIHHQREAGRGQGMRVRKAGWLGRAGRQCPFKEKWLVKLAKSGARERKQTEARAEKVANT